MGGVRDRRFGEPVRQLPSCADLADIKKAPTRRRCLASGWRGPSRSRVTGAGYAGQDRSEVLLSGPGAAVESASSLLDGGRAADLSVAAGI